MAISKHFKGVHPASKNTLLFSVIFHQIKTYISQESAIYQEHLKEYPYCGEMNVFPTEATKRAVNAKTPKNQYRWAVLIVRYVNEGKDDETRNDCSGSVITDR